MSQFGDCKVCLRLRHSKQSTVETLVGILQYVLKEVRATKSTRVLYLVCVLEESGARI